MGRVSWNGVENTAVHSKGAVQRHLYGFPRPRHFPWVGIGQPAVRVFHLAAIFDGLPENAVLVPETIARRRDLHRREGVDEACGQAAEAAIAESGVGLG